MQDWDAFYIIKNAPNDDGERKTLSEFVGSLTRSGGIDAAHFG